jgi:hypothetical protein
MKIARFESLEHDSESERANYKVEELKTREAKRVCSKRPT